MSDDTQPVTGSSYYEEAFTANKFLIKPDTPDQGPADTTDSSPAVRPALDDEQLGNETSLTAVSNECKAPSSVPTTPMSQTHQLSGQSDGCTQSLREGAVQSQIDAQPQPETSTSQDSQCDDSAWSITDGEMYIGNGNTGHRASHQPCSAAGDRGHAMVGRSDVGRDFLPKELRSEFHADANPANYCDATDTNELLEVVAYKFRQQEMNLKTAFSADHHAMRSQLQRAQGNNDALRAKVANLEEQLDHSEVSIDKYRRQIAKAKGLQKFLEGLGHDLQSLKRSHHAEKSSFTTQIEESQAEISRLQTALASRDDYETAQVNAKISLEKLLVARESDLQSVITHRDLLRTQLDEKIGQLVEERDHRSKLEEIIVTFRSSDTTSLVASVEQCVQSLLPRLTSLDERGDQLLLNVTYLHGILRDLTARGLATPQDCEEIRRQVCDSESRVTQSLQIGPEAETRVVELAQIVERVIDHAIRPVSAKLGHLESAKTQAEVWNEAHISFSADLKSVTDRMVHLHSEMRLAREKEVEQAQALELSSARVAELEANLLRAMNDQKSRTDEADIEARIKEAVSAAQKQFSQSANTFIAQEKSRYENQLKQVEGQRRKETEALKVRTEELDQRKVKFHELHAEPLSRDSEAARKLSELTDRFRTLQQQHEALRHASDDNASVKLQYDELVAEKGSWSLICTENESTISTLRQQLEERKAELLQVRSAAREADAERIAVSRKQQDGLETLQLELQQAHERIKHADSLNAQVVSSSQKAISDEQEKSRKQHEIFQLRLAEFQTELQAKQKEADDIRNSLEQAFDEDTTSWKQKCEDLQSKTAIKEAIIADLERTSEELRKQRKDLQQQLQSHTPLLDFSGKPRFGTGKVALDEPSLLASSQIPDDQDFTIFEDPQETSNLELIAESPILAGHTSTKSVPQPNSSSKRLMRAVSDKSFEGRLSSQGNSSELRGTGMNHAARGQKTPDAAQDVFESSPAFMRLTVGGNQRRYSGPKIPLLAEHRPITPSMDPRLLAKSGGRKRAPDDEPVRRHAANKKKSLPLTANQASRPPTADEGFLARSSQSVNELPRVDPIASARVTRQSQSSRMRSSGGPRRAVTRQSRGHKEQSYGARFREELR